MAGSGWDEEDAHTRFRKRLKREALAQILGSRKLLASLRHDWPEVQRLTKVFAAQLKELGVSLEAKVSEEQLPEDEHEDVPQEVQVVPCDRLLGRGREHGDVGAEGADENDHPLIRLHRSLLKTKVV